MEGGVMDTNELIRSTIIWDLENSLKKKDAEIELLQKQAHYHYENGLKKDVEIERLRELLTAAGIPETVAASIGTSEWGMQDEGRASYDADELEDWVRAQAAGAV